MVFLMCSESMQIYPTNKFLSEINPEGLSQILQQQQHLFFS